MIVKKTGFLCAEGKESPGELMPTVNHQRSKEKLGTAG